jgi:hypothetical protein
VASRCCASSTPAIRVIEARASATQLASAADALGMPAVGAAVPRVQNSKGDTKAETYAMKQQTAMSFLSSLEIARSLPRIRAASTSRPHYSEYRWRRDHIGNPSSVTTHTMDSTENAPWNICK